MTNILSKFGIVHALAKHFPIILRLKRNLIAFYATISPTKSSYSQYGEDEFILKELNGVKLHKGIYVDVGANQPTQISNTYLFYRHGYKGIAIEANPSLKLLFRRFRPHDVYLGMGCAAAPSLLEFRHAHESVLSGFTDETTDYISTEYLPVLPLDTILISFEFEYIFLLSIDVEGMDFEVIKGATNTLSKVIFLLIEENSENKAMRNFIEEHGFSLVKQFSHNLLYINLTIYNYLKAI